MIPTTWEHLDSSNLHSMKYNPGTQELHIKFHSGAEYVYQEVPPEDAEALYHAPSAGKHLSDHIIGTYQHRRV
jgi:hypothetical protein